MIPDLSDFRNTKDLFILFFAIVTVDCFVLFLTRYFPRFFGRPLNDWYDKYRLNAVLCDVLSIFLGFLITRYIYSSFFAPIYGFNPMMFLILLIIVQAVHDIVFYFFVIEALPVGANEMIDTFKEYSKAGPVIIAGDSLLMLGSAFVAFYFKTQPDHVVASISALVSYALTYILYTRRVF